MSWEPISPELALVDPELRARAPSRPAPGLHELPVAAPRPLRPSRAAPAAPPQPDSRYPFWARVTAALWLLVLGILIGGAAIPHAKDTPRVVPANEDAMFCKPSQQPNPQPQPPVVPPARSGGQP